MTNRHSETDDLALRSRSASPQLRATAIERLRRALASSELSDSAGSTHSFYHYPARFSPTIARTVIEMFSAPDDWVLDPFMGGGTSIIEGLTLGRNMIGVDVNSLATFVARVRTAPLSTADIRSIRRWARRCARNQAHVPRGSSDPRTWNMPAGARDYLAFALELSTRLETPRRRAFARCVLLRLGQKALDCRDLAPRRDHLVSDLPPLVDDMLQGLQQFVDACADAGVGKTSITARRRVLCRSAIGLEADARVQDMASAPRLVFTSPPYPKVHVLYHRWQYRGRREMGAPYWIANLTDGRPGSFYTGGSRTPKGQRDYFGMIAQAFSSVRALIHPEALVVQLVGFSDTASQLDRYLDAMQIAGFEECRQANGHRWQLERRVPNRKWYAKLQGDVDPSCEIMLIHRPNE